MKRLSIAVVLLAVLALAVAACGGTSEPEVAEPAAQDGEQTTMEAPSAPATDTTSSSPSTITVELTEQNGSGQNGTATLSGHQDGTFDVQIEMSPPSKFPGPAQNAHIHSVSCTEYAAMTDFNERLATVVDWLSSLAKGLSSTKVTAPLAERATGTYAINVHEQNAPYTVVACGDIPKQ